jgi:glycosyltransferase involved in cell wall biosynthesis
MLVADAVGGVWDYALTLSRGLIQYARAHVLLVVVGPEPDETLAAGAAAVPDLEFRVLTGRLEWMEGGRDWLHAWRRALTSLAVEWRADVVHVNQLGLAALGRDPALDALPRRPPVVLGVHSDVSTWWLWVKDGGHGPCTLPDYLSWQRDLARDALQLADVVVCPSAFLAGELVASHGLERSPVVIHNAVVPPAGPTVEPGEHQPGVAAVVGRAWDEAKNLAVVADALRRCRNPWQIEVAGDVVEPGQPQSSPALPSAPGLFYLGFLPKDRLASLYGRASVCLAPSSYEPFGLAPAEAALSGCAVVANDIPSYREVWGEAASYFGRNDPSALAGVLDRLYDDPAAVASLAAAARERVAMRYTLPRMIERYLAVYRAAGREAKPATGPASGAAF